MQTLYSGCFSWPRLNRTKAQCYHGKVFVSRALSLLEPQGSLGYVLPGNSLIIGGWAELRSRLFASTETSIVEARNSAGWLFDDVHHSYAIALIGRGARGQVEGAGVVRTWVGVHNVRTLIELKSADPIQLTSNMNSRS